MESKEVIKQIQDGIEAEIGFLKVKVKFGWLVDAVHSVKEKKKWKEKRTIHLGYI